MCDCEPKPEVVSLIVKNERERIADAIENKTRYGRLSERTQDVMKDLARLLRSGKL